MTFQQISASRPAPLGWRDRRKLGVDWRLTWVALIGLILSGIPISARAAASQFLEFYTEEGMRVWIVTVPQAETVNLALHVPVGAWEDPQDMEGLAHYLEHMLFTDNDGRDELEFFKELEERGGKANGYTSSESTFYEVYAPARELSSAIDWMRRLLFDHAFKETASEKERKIVILESNLRPKEFSDYMADAFDLLRFLDPPGFWEKHFGIEPYERKVGGSYESMHSITVRDLQSFYDTYYLPSKMTLFISGRVDPQATKDLVLKNFRPKDPSRYLGKDYTLKRGSEPRLRRGFERSVEFVASGTLAYQETYKFLRPSQSDVMTLFFLRDFLREYLNDELRFKGRTTYSVSTDLVIDGEAGYLSIGGDFAPEDMNGSRMRIEKILQDLRSGEFPEEVFLEYRGRALAVLNLSEDTPASRSQDFQRYFFNRTVFRSFPDQREIYAGMKPETLQTVMKTWVTPVTQLQSLEVKAPLSDAAQFVLGLIFALGMFTWLRCRWISAVDLRKLRYMRKFHHSAVQWVGIFVAGVLFYAAYLACIQWAVHHVDQWIEGISWFWLRFAVDLAETAAHLFLLLLPLTYFPRKILLLTDGLVIKFFFVRSWHVPYRDVQFVDLESFPGWMRSLPWPLALGWFEPGILLRLRNRPGFYFITRNNGEFLSVLDSLRQKDLSAASESK